VVNSLSGSTSSALDQNQLYSDQNQVFGAAAGYEAMTQLGIALGGGGVFVQGGNNADNTAYAVANSDGNQVGVFGIEYTGSTLYGYSPDPDFVQSTIINATLTGNVGGTTAWTLLGGLGQDSIVGGNNDGEYIVGDLETLVGANQGRIFAANSDTIVGNNGTSTIWGDFVLGLDANGDIDTANVDGITIGADDSIVGGANGDTIFGGGGNDDILAGDGTNLVYGQGGNDSIVSGANTDVIYGGIGNDSIVGSTGVGGDDTFFGGAGNDDFEFSSVAHLEDSSLDGGTDTDTIRFTTDAVTVVDANLDQIVAGTIERIVTANGDNSITLDSNADSAGISTVIGGTGNDDFTLNSSFNNPVTLLGGAGNDDFTVNSYSQITSASIDGGVGTEDTLNIVTSLGSSISYEPILLGVNVSNIEILQLGETATNYVNLIGDSNGDFGIANVYGGANVDNNINAAAIGLSINMFGGNNNDQLIAGSNGDTIQGWLISTTNASNDTLTGNTGNDDFVLGNNTDNAYGQSGGGSPIAYIRDFDAGSDILTVKTFGDYNSDSVGAPVGYNTRLFLDSSNTDTIAFLNVTSGVFTIGTDLNQV
jgi:Ca2+-binding RTX toxin-like protein